MLGVNAFCLMEKLGKDVTGTFQAIQAVGIEAVELMVIPVKQQKHLPAVFCCEENFPEMFQEVRNNHMEVPSVHVFCAAGNILFPKKWVIRMIRKLHNDYGIDSFVFSGMFRDAWGAKLWAKYLRKIAAAVKSYGCKILYHNHSQEFTPVNVAGRRMTALDYFFELAGDDVYMQLDIGWAGLPENEVELAKRYASKIMSIHLKDFTSGTRGNFDNGNMPKERFAAIGNGEIRTAEVLAMKDQFPNFNGTIIIDQDHSATDILEDLRIGYQNVAGMLR